MMTSVAMTMSSPPSRSDRTDAYDLFHPEIRRWIRAEGWTQLRDVQEQAAHVLLADERDLLISATTAAGKTEAAFLPLLSLAANRTDPGVALLYVAPLKALINDQYRRLAELCERLGLPLVRWHGDAPQGPKTKLLRDPRGVVLITPESIEAMIVRRPAVLEALFGQLDTIVIDELHAFLQGARGLHLWSLLHRLDALCVARPRRVGLSATIGDFDQARAWLSATASSPPHLVAIEGVVPAIKLQIRTYVEPPEKSENAALLGAEEDSAIAQISAHAFEVLRGRNNLFFAGSRANVETLADQLRGMSEDRSLPNEFFPHHGSLSKELREDLEIRLKEGRLPTTAIATTTLELGIDIGSVHAVAQLGAPRSLSSLRQRLGRSGRREGSSAIFRNYLREPWLAPDSDPLDRLHLPVVQAVAAIRLLGACFVEPSRPESALLSVMVHQILSCLTQIGGCSAGRLYSALCGSGPFAPITKADFAELLRALGQGESPLLEQAEDRTILLGPMGEKIVAGRDFYANFTSAEEWRLVHNGRTLGALPIINLMVVGTIIGFAGRRWRVNAVDDRGKVVEVEAHRAGRIPKFDRIASEPIHDRLAEEMRAVLLDDMVPDYLDDVSKNALADGRAAFAGLARCWFVEAGSDVHVLTWKGSVINALLAALLTSIGFACENFDVGVTLTHASFADARDVLAALDACPPIEELGHFVTNLVVEKYDDFVPEALLRRFWVRRHAHLSEEVTGLLRLINAGV